MCGIFGITIKKEADINPDLLRTITNRLFKLSESRGKESAGIAYLSGDTIKIYKQPLSASSFIRLKEYQNLFKDYPSAIIGHTRLVTNGLAQLNKNNHPIIKNGVVAVHNGIIVNGGSLWKKYPEIEQEYDVDTEVITGLLRVFLNQKNNLIKAAQETFEQIQGSASIAAVFEDYPCLLMATNTGSLYLAENTSGNIAVFASEKYILKTLLAKTSLKRINFRISQIEPGQGCVIEIGALKINKFSLAKNAQHDNLIVPAHPNFKIIDLSPPEETSDSLIQNLKSDFTIFEKKFSNFEKDINNLKRCKKCVLPETMPFIEFDNKGVCNYCRAYKKIEPMGKERLENFVADYKSVRKEPDCLLPFSGGRDSSYGLHYAKKILGMRPVAYSYDWGMITDLARRNQARICGKLGIEHIIVSADLNKKRNYIRKNILAWLKKPDLGMIPIFMAGDKQYFYHINRLKKQLGIKLTIYSENPFEKTDFKSGFCGIKPKNLEQNIHNLPTIDKLKLAAYYLKQFLSNPAYLNSSLFDTFTGYLSHYLIPHEYCYLYHYIKWDENEIIPMLINEYDWETAPDTKSTWRIGDGTAPFYNYVYYVLAGFNENDTFRSNQIREGDLTREKALEMIAGENRPRWESIKWYCDTIGLDFEKTIKTINGIPNLYLKNLK